MQVIIYEYYQAKYKKVARPIYHKVVPEKVRARRAARLNRSLEYETWITMLEANENYDEKFEYNPKISILVPVYNVLDRHLIPCIESVLNQVYTNWELCLADDCSSWDSVRETLAKYEGNEKSRLSTEQRMVIFHVAQIQRLKLRQGNLSHLWIVMMYCVQMHFMKL